MDNEAGILTPLDKSTNSAMEKLPLSLVSLVLVMMIEMGLVSPLSNDQAMMLLVFWTL